MSPEQFQKKIVKFVDERGGVNATARKLGVSCAFVSQVYNGHKLPTDVFLDAMGYTKEIKLSYEKIEPVALLVKK